jgi:hypothetical protein
MGGGGILTVSVGVWKAERVWGVASEFCLLNKTCKICLLDKLCLLQSYNSVMHKISYIAIEKVL